MDLDHFVRGQEAVFDTLPKRVGVNRLPEVMNVGNVLGFLRGSPKADLGGGREIFENFTPRRIVGGTATMTLVNDDQIKKAARELTEKLLTVLRPSDRLIESQIYLIGGVDAPLSIQCCCEFDLGAVVAFYSLRPRAQFRHRSAEGTEIIHHRLIDQDVAVG